MWFWIVYPAEAFSIAKFSIIIFLCYFLSTRKIKSLVTRRRITKVWVGRNGGMECLERPLWVIPKPQTPPLQMQWPHCNVGVRGLEWEGCRDRDGKSPSGTAWWYTILLGAASHRCLLARPVRVGRSLLRETQVKGGGGSGAPGSCTVGCLYHHSWAEESLSREGLERAVEQQAPEQGCPFPWQLFPAGRWRFALGNPHIVGVSKGWV